MNRLALSALLLGSSLGANAQVLCVAKNGALSLSKTGTTMGCKAGSTAMSADSLGLTGPAGPQARRVRVVDQDHKVRRVVKVFRVFKVQPASLAF